jgi:hypothetical protein
MWEIQMSTEFLLFIALLFIGVILVFLFAVERHHRARIKHIKQLVVVMDNANEKSLSALRRYGRHDTSCGDPCTCGLEDALENSHGR